MNGEAKNMAPVAFFKNNLACRGFRRLGSLRMISMEAFADFAMYFFTFELKITEMPFPVEHEQCFVD